MLGCCSNNAHDVQAPSKAAAKPAGYEVPPDFDKAVLQVSSEDLGTKQSAQSMLPHAFWLRWLHLRTEVRLHTPILHCTTHTVSTLVVG